jgi:hypothetical protein
LQLEKQYKDINNATAGKGGRILANLIGTIGTQLINRYAKTKVEPAFVDIMSEIREKQKKG